MNKHTGQSAHNPKRDSRRKFIKTTSGVLATSAAISPAIAWSGLTTADRGRVLIVVGPSNHKPGTHEVAASGRLMKHSLESIENLSGVKADVVLGWPDKSLRDAASTIVFIGDMFPANRLPNPKQNLADLEVMMDRGAGIVCVHYATGVRREDVLSDGSHPLLRWMGGYFAHSSCPHHQSIARVFPKATITPAALEHPVTRGCEEFSLHDEPYINNYFGPDGNQLAPNVTTLATSMLPPEAPKLESVAWSVERPDGGRGFGIVMPHFYKNWRVDELRRLILNGIVWTGGIDVPRDGVTTKAPELADFNPESVEVIKR